MIDTEGYIACDLSRGERVDQHSDRPIRHTRKEAELDVSDDHWKVMVVGSDGMLYDWEPEDDY